MVKMYIDILVTIIDVVVLTRPSLATPLYRPSLPWGLPCYILYRHRAVVYRFLPDVLTSSAVSPMSGSSNLDSFLWWVVGGRTAAVLWSVASRTCSIQLEAFLCNAVQIFLHTFVSIHVVHPYSSIDMTADMTTWPLHKTAFYLIVRSDFYMTDSLSITVHAFASCMLMRHYFQGSELVY